LAPPCSFSSKSFLRCLSLVGLFPRRFLQIARPLKKKEEPFVPSQNSGFYRDLYACGHWLDAPPLFSQFVLAETSELFPPAGGFFLCRIYFRFSICMRSRLFQGFLPVEQSARGPRKICLLSTLFTFLPLDFRNLCDLTPSSGEGHLITVFSFLPVQSNSFVLSILFFPYERD